MNGISEKKLEKLRDKRYRDAYVASNIIIGLPYQIRALREQEGRKWSQGELGKKSGKPRNVISRIENPEYGQLTIRTLLELASAFDVALLVKYVSFSRFLSELEDVSPQALEVPSFDSELKQGALCWQSTVIPAIPLNATQLSIANYVATGKNSGGVVINLGQNYTGYTQMTPNPDQIEFYGGLNVQTSEGEAEHRSVFFEPTGSIAEPSN